MERRNYLERLIMGLEQTMPDMKSRLQYYDEKDVEKKYAEKFIQSMEKNLEEARRELAELEKKGGEEAKG